MDWDDLKVFAAIIEHRTVRRAAPRLGLHHATVARRLERLEADLGTRLFDRRPEGLCLTPRGEDLSRFAQRMEREVEDTVLRLAGQDSALTGVVTLSLPEPMASHILAPHLPEFADRYPDLDLHLDLTYAFADLMRGEADIAIRFDNNPPERLVGKRLFPMFETIYASRGYLAALKEGTPPRWIGWAAKGRRRPDWVVETAFKDTPIWGGIPDISAQIAVAHAGLGLVALPCSIGDADPRLCRAIPDPPRRVRDIWLLTHPDLSRTSRIQAVMGFVEDVLRRNRSAFLGEVVEKPEPLEETGSQDLVPDC